MTNFRKYTFLAVLLWSILLMLAFSGPQSIDRLSYDAAWYYIMGVSGLLWMVVMTWQVLLGIRPAFGRWIKDFFRINSFHKWLGIWTMMSLIFHPIAAVIAYGTWRLYVFSLDFSTSFDGRISVGKIAFDLILIVLITSVVSRKMLSYRSRHWIHLLSYPAFIGVWLHWWFTWTMIAEIPAVRIFWIIIGVVLLAAMIARIAYQYGYLKTTSKVLAHTQKTHDVFELQLSIPQQLPYRDGQFVYLQARAWWESHPFTILSYDQESSLMRIAYKVYGQFTQSLTELKDGESVFVDWPYGVFLDTIPDQSTPVVCIAAWIWITPFYQIISNYAATKEMKLFYLNKYKSDAVYGEELEWYLEANCVNILSREQKSIAPNDIVDTRISSSILEEQLWARLDSAHFYLCGWGAIIMSVTEMLVGLWVDPKRIDYEPFTM